MLDQPLVSCLCVTENRPAFMPWLLWCFDRQRWPHRELVIVDSSLRPFQIAGRPDVRVVAAPPGTGVAAKRNQALQAARGTIVTWFDDDDWQHPDKLACLVEALRDGAPYAGSRQGWFVDLARRTCAAYRGPANHVIFNSAGFLREAVLPVRFPEDMPRASDTRWMQQLAAQHGKRAIILERDDLFFWLCHSHNLSNSSRRRRCTQPLTRIKAAFGADAWGDTDAALEALYAQLPAVQAPTSAPAPVASRAAPPQRHKSMPPPPPAMLPDRSPGGTTTPTVSVMIKATVLDAPYLDVMARHMIAQARFAFLERVVVVDTPPRFTGKYHSRPRADRATLDRVLERLLADGVIDRVCEVDPAPATARRVLECYFGAYASRVPTHAGTGGPIYATLYGLESMATDHVLQLDADMFFHTGPESWVGQALACMAADPRLWLMMAHPGPPAGPPGRSLRGQNANLADWDGARGIWRFRTATTRYFLCDRRNLRGRLQPVLSGGVCAPLEQCISLALQRHGAFRGNLGQGGCWHLHAWHHGDPFPAWAGRLASAVAAGTYPALQQGSYDLRLDRAPDRSAWGRLLEASWPIREGREEREGGKGHVQPDLQTLINDRSYAALPHPPAPSPRLGEGEKSAPLPLGVGEGAGGWGCLVGHCGDSVNEGEKEHPQADLRGLRDLRGSEALPLAVVIPVRNRAGPRLRNALASLGWQTAGRPEQIIVVSCGSRPEIDRELAQICAASGATLLAVGDPAQPWNKPFALNCGIRATRPEIAYLMTMDADMILAPTFLEVVIERLRRPAPALVLCRSSDLPAHVALPEQSEQLLAAFPRLRAASKLRSRAGTGGIQAAQRAFFFEIRGYDEDLLWWGAMDGDIVNRARIMQLEVIWIDEQTSMLHQWHARKEAGLTQHREIAQARGAWRHNHELVQSRSQVARRNPQGWGGCPEIRD